MVFANFVYSAPVSTNTTLTLCRSLAKRVSVNGQTAHFVIQDDAVHTYVPPHWYHSFKATALHGNPARTLLARVSCTLARPQERVSAMERSGWFDTIACATTNFTPQRLVEVVSSTLILPSLPTPLLHNNTGQHSRVRTAY